MDSNAKGGVHKLEIAAAAVRLGVPVLKPLTEQIDLLAAYCGELDRCFLLPVSLVAGRREIALRLASPRNA